MAPIPKRKGEKIMEDTKIEAKVEAADAKVKAPKAAKSQKKAKANGKARTKTTTKKTGGKKLKIMKSKAEKGNERDVKAARALINKVLTSKEGIKAGLTFTENGHGALQVKRGDGLMFTFRHCGKGCIITHPIYQNSKGQPTSTKTKTRWMKHSGSKWDHLTDCKWSDVTLKMLMDRIKDTNSVKEHHDAIYKGKKLKNSGLVLKREMAQKRMEKLKKETKKSTNKKKREKASVKKASNVVKRQAKKTKKSGKASPVIKKVAEAVSAS
jgi:hypothetical protein